MPHKALSSAAIVDYGIGNLFSVRQACEHVGIKPVVTSDKSIIESSEALILPGVGAFGDAMDSLRARGLLTCIKDFVSSGKPFMGICLGMQLLMSESEEFGIHEGLDIIQGRVSKFPGKDNTGIPNKVPQVGWNGIHMCNGSGCATWKNTPFDAIHDGSAMYFVHSYYVCPNDKSLMLSTSTYGGIEYCSSLLWKNVFAVQFHPEKSAADGLKIYKTWKESTVN